jgi:hypothetical protein
MDIIYREGNEVISLDPTAVQLALAPFVAFMVIVGVFIYVRNRKS